MNYKAFEEKLKSTSWEDRVRLAIKGVRDNIITMHLKKLRDLNLPTLEIRFPEVYEAVKDENARKALVLTGLFIVSNWKGPKECLELEWPQFPDLTSVLCDCSWGVGKEDERPLYTGTDAVRILVRSLLILYDEIRSILWYPIQADPWRTKNKEQATKLKAIMEEMLGRYAGWIAYYMWHNEELPQNRNRLTKLLRL
jgi:hypothetical protein